MDFITVHFKDDEDRVITWLINVNHLVEVFRFPDDSCGIRTTQMKDEYTPVSESYTDVIAKLKVTGRCYGE